VIIAFYLFPEWFEYQE